MLLGLVVISAAMTILYLGMRSVMDVGGFCAEGGPYQIAVHCPKGVAYMLPLSIFAGIVGLGLYGLNRVAGGPNIMLLLWSILFGSLGWNFLEYAFSHPEQGIIISWLVTGVIFELMALVPLYALGAKLAWGALWGIADANGRTQPLWFAILHTLCLVGGIYGGYRLLYMAA